MNQSTPPNSALNRRQFLARTSIPLAVVSIVPGSVLGLNGAVPPGEKLNLAGIGIGGQGASDLRELESQNIVALCDVDQRHADHTYKRYPKARKFTDYRSMLDEMKEIDGVVIATPDHHHAFASMEAIRRKKHVYCEKPLTHSVWEARQVATAARAAKVATQMGNQGQASRGTRNLCELVWAGAIGNVLEAHIWTDRPSRGLFDEYWPQGVGRPQDKPAVPDSMNWDLWLGPAPERPYSPAYAPFRWRGWWDFGTGALGDIGCHAMDPVFRALRLGAPLSVQASSTRVNAETFPLGSMVTYHFPARAAGPQSNNMFTANLAGADIHRAMPPCKLVWYDGGLRPPRPEGLPQGKRMGDNGRLLIGDAGFILDETVYPAERAKDFESRPFTIPASPGHYLEWVEACKGGAKAGSNFDWAGPLAEAVLLGNVALRPGLREDLTLYRLEWDPVQFRFTNAEEPNQFLKRAYRAGWSLDAGA